MTMLTSLSDERLGSAQGEKLGGRRYTQTCCERCWMQSNTRTASSQTRFRAQGECHDRCAVECPGDAADCPARQGEEKRETLTMTSFGRKAAELVKEIATSDESNLPPYNVRRLQAARGDTRADVPHFCLVCVLPLICPSPPRASQEQLVAQVKTEAQEHFRALLASLQAIQASSGGTSAAAPEEAANVMVHNRAILRNKRLLLAYMYVAGAQLYLRLCGHACRGAALAPLTS